MSQPTSEFQIQFLSNIQRLLSEGLFVATYKYALLIALADICIEQGRDDDSTLELPTWLIAEKFIQYYWRQSMPFVPEGISSREQVLQQNTGKQAGIIKLVVEARRHYSGSITDASRDKSSWKALVTKVDAVVRLMPLWKLQTVGGQQLDFIYDTMSRGTRIVLKPGVAFCFRKHYPLITDLVKGAWARYVRRFNMQVMGVTSDLHEFLFGSERACLAVVKPILNEFQKGKCFYCKNPLREDVAHVDHFIPWARYPVDLGHNFVMAHASCNSKKSDRLAFADHLDEWVDRSECLASEMGREFDRSGVVNDHSTSVRIVNWAYTQTYDCRGLTWARGEELHMLPEDWNRSLQRLLN
jgi:hypothetical protein